MIFIAIMIVFAPWHAAASDDVLERRKLATNVQECTSDAQCPDGYFCGAGIGGNYYCVQAVAASASDSSSDDNASTVSSNGHDVCTGYNDVLYKSIGSSEVPDYTSDCDSASNGASYMKLVMGSVTDYFKPIDGSTWCEMLESNDKHLWSADGETWVQPQYYSENFGGSYDWWPRTQDPSDGRAYLSFWGGSASTTYATGGCCHTSYAGGHPVWAISFELYFGECDSTDSGSWAVGADGCTITDSSSCSQIKATDPNAGSGCYHVVTETGTSVIVECDMDRDGGRTLIYSRNNALFTPDHMVNVVPAEGTSSASTESDSTSWFIPTGDSRWTWEVCRTDGASEECESISSNIPQEAYQSTHSAVTNVQLTGFSSSFSDLNGQSTMYYHTYTTASSCSSGGGSWWGITQVSQGSGDQAYGGIGGHCDHCSMHTGGYSTFNGMMEYYLFDWKNVGGNNGIGGSFCGNRNAPDAFTKVHYRFYSFSDSSRRLLISAPGKSGQEKEGLLQRLLNAAWTE